MKKIDNVTIKRWTEDDWQAFKEARIEAVTEHSYVFLNNYKRSIAYPDSHWKNILKDTRNAAVFGLYDDETVIGLTGAFRHREKEDTVKFGMSYILSEYRGSGCSDLFYKERVDWAKAQDGITRIEVGHRAGNEASRRANQRHGFILISTEDITFGNGETDKHYTYELKI